MRKFSFQIPTLLKTVIATFVFATACAVFAADTATNISLQTATSSGSNGSFIVVGTGGTSPDATSSGLVQYVNKDSDQTIIGNYLKGYYYDTQFGFFKLDWNADPTLNVRFTSSSPRCASGYGYALGGYAYGTYGGLIKFDYSPDISVYYCESDQKLHGYAYSADIGFQSFEWVSLQDWSGLAAAGTINLAADANFANNSTMLLTSIPPELQPTFVQGERQSTGWGVESIFYIVK